MTSCCTIIPGPALRCTIFFSFGQAPHSLPTVAAVGVKEVGARAVAVKEVGVTAAVERVEERAAGARAAVGRAVASTRQRGSQPRARLLRRPAPPAQPPPPPHPPTHPPSTPSTS
jgi:hypothetical protein